MTLEEKQLFELRTILDNQDEQALREYVDAREPIDFVEEIRDLEEDELTNLLGMLDDDDLASVMEEADDDERIHFAHLLDNHRLLVAFSYMQKDDIVDMLGDFPIGRRKEVLNLMREGDQRIIRELLRYPPESAGGLMTTAYIALKGSLMISKALQKIREIGPKTEVIETIYITNDDRQLIGYADLRDILSAPRDMALSSVTKEHVISVEPETDQEEVASLVSRYDLNSIPVVSASRQILGIITVDDIIDVIVEEYNEDMLQMAGVNKEENLDTTLFESVRLRLPWLLVNLATAFLASFTVKMFEGTISKVVALSAIMTIVTGMGGNAGSQTMSIMVRALADEDLSFKKAIRPLIKEILLGAIDGAATGLVTALIVVPTYHNFFLGVIVLIAMIGNLVNAGIFGFLVPVVLKKLHADPAIASSIFVTTATDVLGFFIFLGMAQAFLPLLT